MVKIRQAIVVEGRYDKNTLAQVVDAPIFQTDGFGIRKNREQLALLRRVAQKRGLVILTDSDGAGFMIRNYLKSAIPTQYLLHAYIPDVYGKERRKTTHGKEGKLGVEGMPPQVLLNCLRRAGVTFEDETALPSGGEITKQDLADLGLSGGHDSQKKRKALLKYLELPEHMSCNAMLQALNLLCTQQELKTIVGKVLE